MNTIVMMMAHAEPCGAFARLRPAGFVGVSAGLIKGQGTTVSGAALCGTAPAAADAPILGDDSALATFYTTDVAHSVPWRPPV